MRGSDVTIPAGGTFPEIPAYAVLPAGAHRGVVVIHEVYGRQPEIDRVVHRFADRGYAAVAPDLIGATSLFTCMRQSIQAVRTGAGPAVDAARGVRAWLCTTTGVAERNVGIIGFCLGGGFALGVGAGWGAISTNYGLIPRRPAVLKALGPTIGCYGGRDRAFGRSGARLLGRLGAAGVPVEAHTFDGVGHSFLTDGAHPVAFTLGQPIFRFGYDPATAEEGWRRIFTFFDAHLG
jgi:carboxymethylenebutenolidase